MGNVPAESKCFELPGNTVGFDLLGNKIGMLIAGKLCDHFPFFTLRQSIIYKLIPDAVIFERHNQIIDDGVPQTEFIGDILIEQFEHVLVVHTFRSCGQTKQEFRFKISDDLFVSLCGSMVAFVDDNVIEFVPCKQFQRSAHRQIGGEHEIRVHFLTFTAENTVCNIAAEHIREGFQGFLQNRTFMNNVKQPVRIKIQCIKSSKIRFTTARSTDNQRFVFANCTISVQFLERFPLHEIRLDIAGGKVVVHIPAFDGEVQFIRIKSDDVTVQQMCRCPLIFKFRHCLTVHIRCFFVNNHIPFDIFQQCISGNIG